MRKILVALLTVFVFVACGDNGNVFEQLAAVYEDAIEKMDKAESMDDIHSIAKDIDEQIKKIEESTEYKEMQNLNESEAEIIEKYNEDLNAVIGATLEFEEAIKKAIKRIASEQNM